MEKSIEPYEGGFCRTGRNLYFGMVRKFGSAKSLSSACGTQRGKLRNTVESDLSNHFKFSVKERKAWMKGARVTNLSYCQYALESFREQNEKAEKRPFPKPADRGLNHEFVVVEVCSGDSDDPIYILAERTGSVKVNDELRDNEDGSGINVRLMTESESSVLEENTLHKFTCYVQLELKEVLDALDDAEPNYNVAESNCWEYAVNAFRRVLQLLATAEGVDPDLKRRIESEYLEGDGLEHLIDDLKTNGRFQRASKAGG